MTRSRSVDVYRRLLRVLPAGVRADAEDEMVDVFAALHRRAARIGPAALAALWVRSMIDLACMAAAERLPSRPPSSRGRIPMFAHLHDDLTIAARRLARSPGWTLSASGTLALGLAAAIVALVLVRDVLLRPLPFPEAGRLVRLVERSARGRYWPSYPNAVDWRNDAHMFSGVGIVDAPRTVPVVVGARAARVDVARAGVGLFETLGVHPVAGRFFTADEYKPGGPAAAIVTERFWRTQLGAQAPGTMTIAVGTEHYAVVGVLPDSFRILGDGEVLFDASAWGRPADVWTALDRDSDLGGRSSHGYHVIARLAPGVSLERARADLNALAARFKQRYGNDSQADSVIMTRLQNDVTSTSRQPLLLLLAAALGVLLAACLNLAAALLAGGLGRARELSVRVAIGASRWRVARQLMVEACVIAVPGVAIGLAAAGAALRVIVRSAPGTLPRIDQAQLDAQAALGAVALAMVTALVAGLLPAVVLSRGAMRDHLRSHGSTGPPNRPRLWTGLVVAQVALTVALLAGAGLLVRSFVAALSVDLGYDPSHVLAVDVSLPPTRYDSDARRRAYYDAAIDRLRATPGVRAAGLTSRLPFDTTAFTGGTERDRPGAAVTFAGYRVVDPGYFQTLGIPRLAGDARALERGVLIDRALRDRLWKQDNPVGDRVRSAFAESPLTVAGIVGSVREWNQEKGAVGVVYDSVERRPLPAMHAMVRYDGTPAAAITSVQRAFAAVNPLVPVTIRSLAALTREALRGRRLLLTLAVGFGVVALLLAASGVYGMVAFAVARQARESAIRLALGAPLRSLRRRVVRQGLLPAVAGSSAGIALALAAGRAMRAQLFQVAPGRSGRARRGGRRRGPGRARRHDRASQARRPRRSGTGAAAGMTALSLSARRPRPGRCRR